MSEQAAESSRHITDNAAPRLWQPSDPINYADPHCTCRIGGMGRRTDCPVHGERRVIPSASTEEARDA